MKLEQRQTGFQTEKVLLLLLLLPRATLIDSVEKGYAVSTCGNAL